MKKDKDNKIYLLNCIIDQKFFKTKDFWESLLLYSISKDVVKSNKRDEIKKENEKKAKINNDNIVFSQILSLIENMFDFGGDEKLIREIIEPKIIFYKIEDQLKSIIYELIDNKFKEKEKNKK